MNSGGDANHGRQRRITSEQWTRMFYGLQIQFRIDAYVRDLSRVQWGIIQAQEGHLVVPDYPAYTIIPLTPTLCLCSGGQTRNHNQAKSR